MRIIRSIRIIRTVLPIIIDGYLKTIIIVMTDSNIIGTFLSNLCKGGKRKPGRIKKGSFPTDFA